LDQPSLIVVGTGIRIIGQMTIESIAWIKAADQVLYLAPDPVAGEVIRGLNPNAESLAGYYVEGQNRGLSLRAMVVHVMKCVCSGKRICLVCYGHPGVLCWVGHEAVRQARAAGYTAKMLPSISAEDCLFADLGLDPGTHGCQSFEATDYLKYGQKADPSSVLILWQIEVTGEPLFRAKGYENVGFPLLVKRLCRIYGPSHHGIIYTAATRWGAEPLVRRVPLGQLDKVQLSGGSMLCIPPARARRSRIGVVSGLRLDLPKRARSERPPGSRKLSAKRSVSRPSH
jgi:hypothetical protein